ncbi:MAG: hypothetical protein WBA53_17955 [Burkholderiaceae bacterium]
MSTVRFPVITFVRWIALIVVVVVTCFAALLLSQQKVLWDVTEPGMTLSDVRAVLPGAVPPPQPKSLDNGLSLGLVASKVSNLDRAFNAELYFDDHGLQQVLLLPTRLLTPTAAMIEFDELRQAASLRYGRELAGTGTRSAGIPAEAHWRAGPVMVTLRIEQRDEFAAVLMSYAAARGRP